MASNNSGFVTNPCHCPKCKKQLPQIKGIRSSSIPVSTVNKQKLLTNRKIVITHHNETDTNRMVWKATNKPFLEPIHKKKDAFKAKDSIKLLKKETEIPYFESYILACNYYGCRPIRCIDEALKKNTAVLDLHHKHLRSAEFKALFIMFVYDYNIQTLNLEDTYLKDLNVVNFLKICLLENNYITDVDLSSNSFDSNRVVEQIAELIHCSKTITKLNLESTGLRDSHVFYLRQGLMKNNSMIELNISHNSFGDNGGKLFADLIRTNTSLKILNLSWNNLRPSHTSLIFKSLQYNNTLVELSLAFNGLNDVASEYLGKLLIKNKTLANLNIANNRISNEGASDIAIGLAHNTTLETLNISNNPITATGIRYILAAVIQNCTLVTLHMKGISPDTMCMQGIEYLERKNLNVEIDHQNNICSREYRPQTCKAPSVPGDLCKTIRKYLIKERLRARDLFNIWDKRKTGRLNYNDIVEGLNDAGIIVTVFQVEEMIGKLDVNKDGKLSPNEFCGILHIHHENTALRNQTESNHSL